jgi:mercuric ion binding protein
MKQPLLPCRRALLVSGGIGVLGLLAAAPVFVRADASPVAVVQSATVAVENMTCALSGHGEEGDGAGLRCAIRPDRPRGQDGDCGLRPVVFDPSATTVGAITADSADAGYPATVKVQDGTDEGRRHPVR